MHPFSSWMASWCCLRLFTNDIITSSLNFQGARLHVVRKSVGRSSGLHSTSLTIQYVWLHPMPLVWFNWMISSPHFLNELSWVKAQHQPSPSAKWINVCVVWLLSSVTCSSHICRLFFFSYWGTLVVWVPVWFVGHDNSRATAARLRRME